MRTIAVGRGVVFGRLVHPSVRNDRIQAARHQSFIAAHVTAGFAALLVLPVYLAIYGQPRPIEALAFSWFVSPIAISLFLSRSGRYEVAHLLSVANLAGLITFAAAITGGFGSFLLPWMIVVPFEAALSASRRVALAGAGFACLGLAVLFGLDLWSLLPATKLVGFGSHAMVAIGTLSAAVYSGGLAASIYRIHTEAEQAARSGEQRYRLLAENATDMITRHSPNGSLTFVSVAAGRLLGAPLEELYGDGLLERVHVADRPMFLMAFSRAAQTGQTTSVEVRLRRDVAESGEADGSGIGSDHVWVETRCRPVTVPDEGSGEPVTEIVAVTRDIAVRKEQERELMRTREAAEAANRAKTQFLASMSHELRTPLNAIIGFSEILSDGVIGEVSVERRREYAALIRQSGMHLLSLVNDILNMSRLESGQYHINPQPFDPAGLVSGCCSAVEPEARAASLTLRQEVAEDIGEVIADERACRQIFFNLLSNAIKFSKPGGTVTATLNVKDDHIHISVSDTGIGISAQDLVHLGKPFVQSDSSYSRNQEGVGLGLSVVKGLAQLHGGRLEIESEVGVGTRVMVNLPQSGMRSEWNGESSDDKIIVPMQRTA